MEFSDVFELGSATEFVRQSESAYHEVKGKFWLIDTLYELVGNLTLCEIEDESIFDAIREWINKLDRSYKKGQKINRKDGKDLSDEAGRWQDLVIKELCSRPCVEYKKGALNQKALQLTSEGKPSDIFENKVWKKLPKIAQSDFSDSAKCLLIGASTPATMVGLRGIEAVIREYYAEKTGKDAKKDLGKIVRDLQNTPDINQKLIGYFDYIRSEKRNIAQHPDKVFTQREAERIFMEIINATHDILTEISGSQTD